MSGNFGSNSGGRGRVAVAVAGAMGRMAGWPDGRMAGWPDGRLAGWAGGQVGGWAGVAGCARVAVAVAGWLVGWLAGICGWVAVGGRSVFRR